MKNKTAEFIVIPAKVRFAPGLMPMAKLLYGEIISFCDCDGKADVSLDFLAYKYLMESITVSRLIGMLHSHGFIDIEKSRLGMDHMTVRIHEKFCEGDLLYIISKRTGLTLSRKNSDTTSEKTSGSKKDMNSEKETPEEKREKREDARGEEGEKGGLVLQSQTVPNPPLAEEFEEWWKSYPRKLEKKKAKVMYCRLREHLSKQYLAKCLANYVKSVDGSETQFIMHSTTFLGPSERFADYEAGPEIRNAKVSSKPKPQVIEGVDFGRSV